MNIVTHASYILNPCNSDAKKLNVTRGCFLKECKISEKLGIKYIVFHPGTSKHDTNNLKEILLRCSETINYVLSRTENCVLLIENMAGQGHTLGIKLSHLKIIINKVQNKERIGICLDSCHLHASGYAIHTEIGFNDFIKELQTLQLESFVKVIHVNDSKTAYNSRVDRHMSLAKGTLGINSIIRFINHFNNRIMILETPNNGIENDLRLLR